ncbi:MAG: DUF4364 family protein [Parasporobacterium sp.]|nr:DUF4364 family protein [Parasporobacterium sp.]
MTVDSSTIYKLMILYMLNRLDCQLTNSQLSSFFIEKNYTSYFNIQQTLSELVESGFVEMVMMRNTSYYSITPDGYTTLTYFKNQIPKGALEDIISFLEAHKFALKNEVGTQTDYYKHINGDFIVHCVVNEGKSLLYEINLSVPSEEEAKRVCRNFKGYSEDIYSYLISNLLQ